jgi:hypothetical protein
MNLISQNNLLDVYDTCIAQYMLRLGNISEQSSSNICITGGSIQCSHIQINAINELNDVFIKSNKNGEIIVNSEISIPYWYNYNLSNIDIFIFNNDINLISSDEVHNIVYTGDFKTLNNIPKLQNYFDLSKFVNIYLSNINNINEALHNLQLSKYMTIDFAKNMVFDNIKIKSLKLNKYIQSNEDNTRVLILKNKQITYTSDYALYDYIIVKKKSYTEIVNPIEEVFTSSSLYEILLSINENFKSNSSAYDMMINYVMRFLRESDDQFIHENNNLNDITNLYDCREKLQLNKLFNMSFDNDSFYNVQYDMIVYNREYLYLRKPDEYNKILFDQTKYISVLDTNRYYISLNNQTNDFNYRYINQFRQSDSSNLGIIKLSSDFNEYYAENCNIAPTYAVIFDLLHSNLDIINRTSFECSINNFHERSNLLAFSSNLFEISSRITEHDVIRQRIYSNLQIHNVVYTGDFEDLIGFPTNLSLFNNDEVFLATSYVLSELEDKQISRNNLDIGNICLQNIDNVNILGETLNMSFLTIKNSLNFYSNNQVNYVLMNNGTNCQWNSIHIFDNTIDDIGIVKIYTYEDNGYDFSQIHVNDNLCVSLKIVNSLYNELKLEINTIENRITELLDKLI